MKNRGLAALLGVALLLSGCGAASAGEDGSGSPGSAGASAAASSAASAGAGSSAQPEAREAHGAIETTVEGETESVPATLYQGDGWSIYIPDEGWAQEEPALWYAKDSREVRLYVERFQGAAAEPMTMQRCYERIARQYGSDQATSFDFGPLEGNTCFGISSGCFRQAWLTESGEDCWAVFGLYQADSAEGFGVRLAAIAATFSPE